MRSKRILIKNKINFQTTFIKKRNKGSKSKRVDIELINAQKLKKKIVKENISIKSSVKTRNGNFWKENNLKKESKSAIVEANEISKEVINTIDKYSNPSCNKKKENKYKPMKVKAVFKKPSYARMGSKKINKHEQEVVHPTNSHSSHVRPSNPNGISRPHTGNQPSRNYPKPWQRPQTAHKKEEVKNNKEIMEQKDLTRKKAPDIMNKRKSFLKPVIKREHKQDANK